MTVWEVLALFVAIAAAMWATMAASVSGYALAIRGVLSAADAWADDPDDPGRQIMLIVAIRAWRLIHENAERERERR